MTHPIRRKLPRPTHWRDRMLGLTARRLIKPSLALPLPWAAKRRSFALAGWMRPTADGVDVSRVKIAGKTAAVYTPRSPKARLIWVHGGGFVVGSPRSHRGMLSHLAREAGVTIIAPKYRLAPEHPFPAAVEDVCAAVAEIAQEPGPILIGGDSAGGTLALGALAEALKTGPSRLCGAILVSPATDLDPEREVPPARDLLFPLAMFRRIQAAYIRGADPRNPRLSPIHGDYTGAPPVLIHTCAGEYLEEDSNRLAKRLAGQGVQVTLETFQDLPHVFHFMAGSAPSADQAIARLSGFIRERLP